MPNAIGPAFVGGLQTFVVNDEENYEYTITFLPDRANDELQRAGLPPYFYWIPEMVRLSRKGGRGDYKFHHTHFVGVFDETNVGMVEGETQGGVLAFTTTSQFPASVLAAAEKELLRKFSGSDEQFWGIRSNQAPRVTIAPILSNTTAVMNVTPNPDGSVPQDALPAGGTPGAPAGGTVPGEDVRAGRGGTRAVTRGRDPFAPVPHGRNFRAPTAIEPWAWRMEGQGPGSITGGENAYAAALGPIPSEIIWAGFHGSYSPIVVAQHLRIPVWSPMMRLKIHGNWKAIHTHLSANVNAGYRWFTADIKAEMNKMIASGALTVELDFDSTMPGAEDMEKMINARIDLIVQKFMEQAQKTVFEAPRPEVKPAEAPTGGLLSKIWGGNAGLALKARYDSNELELSYSETRHFRYVLDHTISSSLEGFYDEIKEDAASERKYFTRLPLGELGKNVMRTMVPVVNWPVPGKGWVGHPVAFLSGQVGYPMKNGSIDWKGGTFQSTDAGDASIQAKFVRLAAGEVTNPPQGWTPDTTYVKRKVHLLEPPPESESPMVKVFVEQNVIDLDPLPNGTPSVDRALEVRADSSGMLDVGPITLNADLGSAAEVIEVEFRAKGTRADGTSREGNSTRFRWSFADQAEPRFWRIFTGQLDYVPEYDYRVHVTVRGSIFSKGQAWTGPWVTGGSNGSLMVTVPGPTDAGVETRSLTSRELVSRGVVRASDPPSGEDEDVLPQEHPVEEPVEELGAEPEMEEAIAELIEAPLDEPADAGAEESGGIEAPVDEVIEEILTETRGTAAAANRIQGFEVVTRSSPASGPARSRPRRSARHQANGDADPRKGK